ncbi:MAG TPA: EDR1-related protein [Verrucomicrobiae bacterium]|nr:EDR1-related protein [Verrucomicrobiae bacterium]
MALLKPPLFKTLKVGRAAPRAPHSTSQTGARGATRPTIHSWFGKSMHEYFRGSLASRPIWFLALAVGCLWPLAGAGRTLLDAGTATEWKFLTGTNPPPAAWREAGFDDAAWQSGTAPLGYGTSRLTTLLARPPGATNGSVTTWFRRELVASPLQAGEGLDILLCVDDGAVVYFNGREIARPNMPAGDVSAATLARRAVNGRAEGFYSRVSVPNGAWRATGTNVLAVEVHQASAQDADCFFDLALKTLPPDGPRPTVPPGARAAMNAYYKEHFVGPGVLVPDGYVDGGRLMNFDADGRAKSGREILVVDRAGDSELRKQLEFARSPDLQALGPLERAQRLAERIDRLTTPPGGERWVGPAVEQLTGEFANKPVRIGDMVDLGQAGVCRHRSLLFKILADEAGLKSALIRGNYAASGPRGFAHAWNEIYLDDGRRLLVDVMHNGGKPRFPAVTDPEVVRHYLKPDDTPWYSTNAPATARPEKP